MRLYLVFGENTDKLSEYLSAQYEISGTDRTLEAVVATAPHPSVDTFLILGTALTSTVVNGQVNWGLALVRNLAELRRLCPHSRLVVILPEGADAVVREIVHLGIYDVHRVDRVRVEKIPELIDNPRTFADVGIDKAPELETGLRPAMPIEDEEDNNKKSRFSKLPKLNISIPKPRLNKTKSIKTDANAIQEKAIQSDIVTVLSPWIMDCPVAEMCVEIAEQLVQKGHRVGLIDASIKSPGISRVLGIPDTEVWEYDWRLGGPESGIQGKNLLVWPLDPLRMAPADEDAFLRLVDAALSLVDRVVISGGTDPELVAGHALVIVSPHSNHDEIVRAWEYFRPVQNGSLVVVGNAESSGFGLPAIASIDSFSSLTTIAKKLI